VRALDYACFIRGDREPVFKSRINDFRARGLLGNDFLDLWTRIGADFFSHAGSDEPEVIAIRSAFGGVEFPGPVVVTPEVMSRLNRLIPMAPLHIPVVRLLIRGAEERFPGVPVVLVFETSFFRDLPPREYLYAINREVADELGLRRYGFHGLYHQAACGSVSAGRSRNGSGQAGRIISICLEPKPEAAAIIGRRPVTVTSGVTPLEGIPGARTCGELDPSIVLYLQRKLGWGPERINRILTEQSGLLGLAGEPVTLKELYESDDAELKPVRERISYHLLQACGAGMAAMGGLDTIVFSGRYNQIGSIVGPWLSSRLDFSDGPIKKAIELKNFNEPLERIVSDIASVEVLRSASRVEVG
jgi:acetate kinase